jgi:hypothetical protein
MYNLNYTPTTLGVPSWKKLYLGVREQKRLNTTGLDVIPHTHVLRQLPSLLVMHAAGKWTEGRARRPKKETGHISRKRQRAGGIAAATSLYTAAEF